MGKCLGKEMIPDEAYGPPAAATVASSSTAPVVVPRVAKPKSPELEDVTQLVLELLSLLATYVDNGEETPPSLVKLHVIAEKEEGWFKVLNALVMLIPMSNPLGPSAITIVFDDCPLPSKDAVLQLAKMFHLNEERVIAGHTSVCFDRNICIILGCIADKLAGPHSIAVLTEDILEYLVAFVITDQNPHVRLHALLALEKFGHTTENKLNICTRLELEKTHPLILLEQTEYTTDYVWRQIAFCAQWALDNIFIADGRRFTYELQDMTEINAILNSQDVSEYLKISADGLEARCDSYSFESVRCTFEVSSGVWYYECIVITPGVMQIGYATKHSLFLNHDGFGIGDDLVSVAYDGCRKFVWYNAKPTKVPGVHCWKPGNTVGCLIDMNLKEVVFSLNGDVVATRKELFENASQGFFAAASFMAFQQCRFNFGTEPFRYPPIDRKFNRFNDFGCLTPEEKKVIPRRLYLAQLRCSTVGDNSCTLCYNDEATCVLEPCNHKGFCSLCTSQIRQCPMCRTPIKNVHLDTYANGESF